MKLKGIFALVAVAGASFAFTFNGASPDLPKWCGTSGTCVDSTPRDYSDDVGFADAYVESFSTTAPGKTKEVAAAAPDPAPAPAPRTSASSSDDDASTGGTSGGSSGSNDGSNGGNSGGNNGGNNGGNDDDRDPSGDPDPDPTEPPPPPPPPTEDPDPIGDAQAAAEQLVADVTALVDTLPQHLQPAIDYVVATVEDTIENPPAGPDDIPTQEEIQQTVQTLSDLVVGMITGLIGDLGPQLQPIIDAVGALAQQAQDEAARIAQTVQDRVDEFDPGTIPSEPPQQQEPVETLTVDSADADGTDTTAALEAGKSYTIVAHGTYLFQGGDNPGAVADPECSANGASGWNPNFWDAAFTPDVAGDDPLDLLVAGGYMGWAASAGAGAGCNEATHEYTLSYTPDVAGAINFRVYDPIRYEDNVGTIEVQIFDGARGVLGEGLDDQIMALVDTLPQTAQNTLDWLIGTAEALGGDPGVPPDPGTLPTQEEVEQAVQQTVDSAVGTITDTIGGLGPTVQPLVDTVLGVAQLVQDQVNAAVEDVKGQLPSEPPGGGDPGPLPGEPPVDPNDVLPGDVPPGGGEPPVNPDDVIPGDVPPGGGDPGPIPSEPPVDPNEIIPSGEEPIDRFSVDSRDADGTDSAVSLDAGTTYWIVASGTYLFAADAAPTAIADAECAANILGGAAFGKNHYGDGDRYDLRIAGSDADWDPVTGTGSGCNEASHKYVFEYSPSGSGPVNLAIYDESHANNVGSLDVEIYNAVPEIIASVGIWPVKVPPAAMALQALLGAAWVVRRRRRNVIEEIEQR